MSTCTLDIRLKRASKEYHEGEVVSGEIIITGNGNQPVQHNGMTLTLEGLVNINLSNKNVGLFEAFYQSAKPLQLFNYTLELSKPGKFPANKTEIPFEIPLKCKGSKQLYETYHGVFINIQYLMKVDMKRSFLNKDLSKQLEITVIYAPDGELADKALTKPIEFNVTPDTLHNIKDKTKIPNFAITGQLGSSECLINQPLSGELYVKHCETPIKSIELQLIRIETCGCAEGYSKDLTEIQNIQIGEGDVPRGIKIPIYMIFPRLFTCPTLFTNNFKIGADMSGRMPKLNRNTSFTTQNSTPGLNNSLNHHSLNHNGNDASPLKLFTRARNAINSIYMDFHIFIGEVYAYMDSYDLSNLIDAKELASVRTFDEKCDGITRMISRDRMKVVFFGRTSNGKSTLINAMLRDKILPTGIGHTTNCFLQVEGIEGQLEPCIYIPENDEAQDIKSLSQIGSALSSTKLDSNSLVRVLWPKDRCRLLKEDVVFVDSPGIDVKSDLDAWIDQQCLDADVFVLVVNAESVLTRTEREFFNKVNERLSKPNVFILNNRWDATAYEPEGSEEVKNQHIQIDTDFLCNELKVCDAQEANNRIYFVSAREALLTRTQTNPQLPPGHQSRLLQFEWFEAEFEKCISMSAVKTKFDQPSQRGKSMVSSVKQFLEQVYVKSNEAKQNSELKYKEVTTKIDFIEKQLQLFTQEIKEKIRNVMDNVEKNVSTTLNDEIKRLYNIIDEYDRPFHPDENQINWYKKELHLFVEQKLGSNLSTRLNTALAQNLELTQKEIRAHVMELIESEENKKQILKTSPRTDFSINYRLDCSNLCSDFKEDVRFRFSLGFTALMSRFMGNTSTQSTVFSFGNYNPNPSFKSNSSSNDFQFKPDAIYENQQRQLAASTNLNPFGSSSSINNINALVALQGLQLVASKSNVMLFAVGGVVWKGLGWKILAVTGTLYGLVYVYERLMWTRKAQERTFKKQYADYASSKLKLIVDLTSQNAAYQVQQELSMYFAQMCRYIDVTRDDLYDDMKKYELDVQSMSTVINQTKILKNKAKYIHDDFDNFNKEYLQLTV